MFRQTAIAAVAAAFLAAACAPVETETPTVAEGRDEALVAAIAAPTRTPANVARDRYRNPYETLRFFDLEADDTVVEIWPGGGWYTEILAPYVLQGGGTYYAAAMTDNMLGRVRQMQTANPSLYGGIRLATFPAFDEAATAACPTAAPTSSSPSATSTTG